ncbi:rod shape-determining protein MreC [Isobaculum melis]|uniref:Cell shape-determining protein MreC n=1 Tax=Isobaculum melis TaxID=142588 RepID=A0A1H9RGP0_9LACT|nr:rod shape-determining protein MreC [Isobaculum melis]
MRQFISNKKLLILLVSVIICVGLIGFSIRDKDETPIIQQIGKDVSAVTNNVLGAPIRGVTNFFKSIDDIKNTYNENEKLKEQLDKLTENQVKLAGIQAENEQLRQQLALNETLRDYTSINGVVISRNPDGWVDKVIVNRGSKDGVAKDMAVMANGGMIGRITEVSMTSSTVQLLTSGGATNRISVETKGEDGQAVFGVVHGLEDKEENKGKNDQLLMKQLSTNSKAKVGEKVTTSGLGGVFPKGLVVGEITEVKMDSFGLAQEAYIKPAANTNDISSVSIIQRTVESGE